MAYTLAELQALDLGYISGVDLLRFAPAPLLLNQAAIGIDFTESFGIAQTEIISELSNQYDFTSEFKKEFPEATGTPPVLPADTREKLVVKLISIQTIRNILGSIAGTNDQMNYWFEWYDKNIEKIKTRSRKLNLPIALHCELANSKLVHARFMTLG